MYCWATVAQISLTDVSPSFWFFLLFFRGGSVCLSWLLEPSLSIEIKSLFCCLFWTYVKNTMSHWYCNTKMMSAVVYIIRPSVIISFYFFPFRDLFCCTWLACFTFLQLLFGNKILWKNNSRLCAAAVIYTMKNMEANNKTLSHWRMFTLLLYCCLLNSVLLQLRSVALGMQGLYRILLSPFSGLILFYCLLMRF